jgi:hypothetical protein
MEIEEGRLVERVCPHCGNAFHLFHALDRDQSLLDVFDLDPGQAASRNAVGERWKPRRLSRIRSLFSRDA